MTFATAAQGSAPDLIFTSGVGVSPNPITVGNNLTVSYTVKNNGTGNAAQSQTRVQVKLGSSSTITTEVFHTTPALSAGVPLTENVTVPIPSNVAAGAYTVYVILDYNNAIGQSDFSPASDVRQTTTGALTIQAQVVVTAPDLIFTSGVGVSPNPITVGNNLTVSYTVKNNGTGNAAQSQTRVQVKLGSSSTITTEVFHTTPALSAGVPLTENVTVPIPSNVAAGAYTVYVILDYNNAIGQSDFSPASDVRQTTTGALTIQAQVVVTAPDLIFTSGVGVSPNPITVGNNLTVSYTVKNNGTGNAAQSQTRVQVKLGSSSTITTEVFHTTPALSAGVPLTENVTVPIPSNVAAGAYTVYVILDYNNAIGQSDFSPASDVRQTTTGALTIQAQVVVTAPDLIFTSGVGVSPNPITVGNNLTVSYTVKNNGTGNAAQSQTRVQVKLGSSSTITTEVFHTTPALSAGVPLTENVTVPIPSNVAAGAYTVYVILDYNNAIGQSDFSPASDVRQTTTGALTIQAQVVVTAPDLIFTSGVGVSPNPITVGNNLTVSYTVKNNGTGNAAQSQTRVQVKLGSSSTITTEVFHTTPALSAGVPLTENVTVPIPSNVAAGAYTVYVILDYNNAIGQSDFSPASDVRQTTTGALTIQAQVVVTAPDLIFTSGVGVSPNPITVGNNLTVSYTVKNNGTGNAAQSQTRVQVKLGSSSTITTEVFHTTPALSAGVPLTENVTVPIPSNVAAGAYTVYVILDYNNAIGQSDFSPASDVRQTTTGALTIQAQVVVTAPDLIFTSGVGVSPNPITVGNNLTVSYTVKNNGTGNAAQSQTRVQVKLGSSSTITTEVFHTTPALSAGVPLTENVTVPIPSNVAAGAYTVYVILDYNNAIGQSDFSPASDVRQTTTGALTIQAQVVVTAPDLIFTSGVGVSPNPITVGNNLTVSYTVKNNGTGNAAQSQTRVQVKLGSSSTITTEVFHTTPALSAGVPLTENVTVPIPSNVAAGAYTVYVILDYNNAIGQSDFSPASDVRQTTTGALTIQAQVVVTAPDLIFTSGVGVSPNPITVGNNLTVSYTVKNNGTGNAAQSQTRVQVKLGSSSTITTEVFHTTPALSAGVPLTENVTVPIPSNVAAGAYTVYVILNYNNAIGQSDFSPASDVRQTTTGALTIQAQVAGGALKPTSLVISGVSSVSSGSQATFRVLADLPGMGVTDVSPTAVLTFVGTAQGYASLVGTTLVILRDAPAGTLEIQARYQNEAGQVVSPPYAVAITRGFFAEVAATARFVGGSNYEITLNGKVTGGTPSYVFRWDTNGDGIYGDVIGAQAVLPVMSMGGRMILALEVTDSTGAKAVAQGSVTIDKPPLPNQPQKLAPASNIVSGGVLRDKTGQPFQFDSDKVKNGLIVITHGIYSSGQASWARELAELIDRRIPESKRPNILIYDWVEDSTPTQIDYTFLTSQIADLAVVGGILPDFGMVLLSAAGIKLTEDLLAIRPIGFAHGEVLGNRLLIEATAIPARVDLGKPIHLIGHSAGGFVVGEAAEVLRQHNKHVERVTMLDTPFPYLSHLTALPDPTVVERYISSIYGALEFPSTRRINESAYVWRQTTFESLSDYAWALLPPAHLDAHEWYRRTARPDATYENLGFYFSPFAGVLVPAQSEHERAKLTAVGVSEVLTGFSTFGSVVEIGNNFTINEQSDAGFYKLITIPQDAEKLRFKFRFSRAGDGDFLGVRFGQRPEMFLGLDLETTRATFLDVEIDLAEFSGKTDSLVFTLVSRGQPGASVEVRDIEIQTNDDADGDGLTTVQELAAGTNPQKADSDGDGWDDAYEVNVSHTSPIRRDTDGDGLSDVEESVAGTDPLDKSSVFAVVDISYGMSGVTLRWSGRAGKTYQVLRSATADFATYDVIATNISGVQPTTTYLDVTVPANVDALFYKVRVYGETSQVVSNTVSIATSTAARAPTITRQPSKQILAEGTAAAFTVAVASDSAVSYSWLHNGSVIDGAHESTLAVVNVQPGDTGIYQATITNSQGSINSDNVILGLVTSSKVIGSGSEIGTDIRHPNGNAYDQISLQGAAASITADSGQVARMSYVDFTNDIVQIEFAGAGTLSLFMDLPFGPLNPPYYNQPGVTYMKGSPGIVITGANETTNVSVFSVGRATAFDPTGKFNILLPISATNNPANNGNPIFRSDVKYDGTADLAFIAITSANGKFGGVRTANASYYATKGLAGIYAPNVQFTGPVLVGDIDAFDQASSVFVLGAANDVRITGGDLAQSNARSVQISGVAQLKFVDGSTSHGNLLPAQANKGRLEQNGTDVTSQIVVNPSP